MRCHSFLVLNTQDDDFHFMLFDLRNGNPNIFYTSQETNLQRVSIMYRVINSCNLLEALIEHDFNEENLRLKLNIVDTFPPENDRSPVIHILAGKPKLVDDGAFNVEVSIDVAGSHLSSWKLSTSRSSGSTAWPRYLMRATLIGWTGCSGFRENP